MAARKINITDTLETFRTQFNALAADDFGDIGTLDASLSATSIIGAVNEINAVVTATAGWIIEDSTSTIQAVGAGQTLKVFGAPNEITAVVSSPDTFTVGLVDAVNITTSLTTPIVNAGTLQLSDSLITDSSGTLSFGNENLTTTGNINVGNIIASTITTSSGTAILGTLSFIGNTIASTDSSQIKINDSLQANEFVIDGLRIYSDGSGYGIIKSTHATPWITLDGDVSVSSDKITMQGATANAYYTTLKVEDPTGSNDIVFPDRAGGVILNTSTGYATSTIFSAPSSLSVYNSAGVLQKTIVGSAS